jgi:hypothetical protein
MTMALVVLKVVKDLEHHLDKAGLKPDGGLVHQQDFRLHDQCTGDL